MKEKFDVYKRYFMRFRKIPRGKNLYYRCSKCNDMVPSVPGESCGCRCGNVFIDVDWFRLAVEDYSAFEIMIKVDNNR